MRRTLAVLVLVVAVAAGVVVGLMGRSWFDSPGSASGDAASRPAPAAVATIGPAVRAPTPAAPRPTPPPALTASSRDVVMEVSESELQSQLNGMLVGQSLGATPLGEATIQTVTVALRDRQVRVGGAAKAGFLSAPFTAAGTVTPDANGRPVVRVSEATVGGVHLPDPARDALAESLQTQVDGLFAERSLRVQTIDIDDGKMRVVGTAGS